MAVQRPHQVGDVLRIAPGRQGDDALAVADSDAQADGTHLITRHGFRIDPHEHSGLGGCRETEVLGSLLDKAFLPAVVGLY